MIVTANLVELIDAYAEVAGLSPHSVGRYSGGSGDFYGRLQSGRDVTTRRAARVVQWLSDHWPDGAEWPADIPRPPPVPPADRAA
ncbi:MAG: hypothetical protein OXF74_02595 [Rhodobacteraceae bacterium]|nr:hypothetical protein [Paracoccaceae bacterium]